MKAIVLVAALAAVLSVHTANAADKVISAGAGLSSYTATGACFSTSTARNSIHSRLSCRTHAYTRLSVKNLPRGGLGVWRPYGLCDAL